jgi:hypothetical protein
MVASAVFITDLQGKSIISRNYRGDVPLNRAVERFAKYLSDTPDEQKKPIFQADSNADFYMEEDVGSTGNDGESYVYVNVSALHCFYRLELNGRLTVSGLLLFFTSTTDGELVSVCRNDAQLQCWINLDLSLPPRASV